MSVDSVLPPAMLHRRELHVDLRVGAWHGSSHRGVTPEHQCGRNEHQHIVQRAPQQLSPAQERFAVNVAARAGDDAARHYFRISEALRHVFLTKLVGEES